LVLTAVGACEANGAVVFELGDRTTEIELRNGATKEFVLGGDIESLIFDVDGEPCNGCAAGDLNALLVLFSGLSITRGIEAQEFSSGADIEFAAEVGHAQITGGGAKLEFVKNIHALGIHVDAQNGIVSLSGYARRRKASARLG
jgi:hypothetical protein